MAPLDIDRFRVSLGKRLSPQTVKHALTLILRLIHFGTDRRLCEPLDFTIKLPHVDNVVTEDLSDKQLERLWAAMENDPDREAVAFLKLILSTGLRRGEAFRLQWRDVDLDKRMLSVVALKSGHSHVVPLNGPAIQALKGLPRPLRPDARVFQNMSVGTSARWPSKPLRAFLKRIKGALPPNFRPLHGCRHAFASRLASTGQVDLSVIGQLLGHHSPSMTQRYSHLRDEALRRASDLAGKALTAQGV